MEEFVPLFETILWIFFAMGLAYYFRKEVKLTREILEKRLREGSSLKLGVFEIGELKKEVNSVKEDVEDINKKVSKLFLLTMSETKYNNLSKIESGNFGSYIKSEGLERELYDLRDDGYVEIESIKRIPESGDNLSKFVKITDAGKEFVKLRKQFLSLNKRTNKCD